MKNRSLFSFFIIFILASNFSLAEELMAWWIKYSFEPINTTAANIKANKIDKSFEFISLLSCGSAPTFTKEQCDEISRNNISLSIFGDANGDSKSKNWYVAVAKSKSSQYYLVLFAMDQNNNLVASFKSATNQPGFSGLVIKDNKLYWVKCMLCGDFEEIEWRNNRWVIAE